MYIHIKNAIAVNESLCIFCQLNITLGFMLLRFAGLRSLSGYAGGSRGVKLLADIY